MTMLLAGILLFALIITGLYVAGWFSTPYSDAFRFAFYLLLVLFVLTVGFALYDHPYEGYDPTVRVP
ncbi:MAG: hypothetical protein A4E19_20045 [Nitrospira sp. SG-bin1]|nr:MAG: hypothetical protein A4E19_20045 [Nitrospira sp. SG-bin1]